MRLHSYVVRYDSGFAPNPFFGFCTLATCKPDIRRSAQIGDWIVGTGSADKRVGKGGFLVYAMRVTETLSHGQYWDDPRFRRKRPNLKGSMKHAAGDNIYRRDTRKKRWHQLNSYHSNADGSPNESHIERDTSVDRVLVSTEYVYFGGHGPDIPHGFRAYNNAIDIVKRGQGRRVIENSNLLSDFESWIKELDQVGYASPPHDWSATLRHY